MDISPLEHALACAKQYGADAADAVLVKGSSLGVSVRNGEIEDLSRSEGADLGLRVFVGQKQACVSTSKLDKDAVSEAAERAVAMAKAAPADPYCGLADQDQLYTGSGQDLDLWDNTEFTAEQLEDMARAAEETALAVEGITNSEGGSAGYGTGEIALATSRGFLGQNKSSSYSISVSTVAGEGLGMERDYDFFSAHHFDDLPTPESIGKSAAERTIKRLNPKKAPTCQVPVIFDPRVSKSILGHFAGAINGSSIARGTSFLKNAMGTEVFAPGINIIDDALIKRGMASKPFDGEGLPTGKIELIKDGRLENWVLDLATARQLGLASNGRASRGTASPPSPSSTNLYMAAGEISPEDMTRDVKDGLYVTELIGMGVNSVTGDYSRGATGFWIKDGVIAHAVNEITITSNLMDMFRRATPASDLEFRYGTNAPTLRIDGMTIAGA